MPTIHFRDHAVPCPAPTPGYRSRVPPETQVRAGTAGDSAPFRLPGRIPAIGASMRPRSLTRPLRPVRRPPHGPRGALGSAATPGRPVSGRTRPPGRTPCERASASEDGGGGVRVARGGGSGDGPGPWTESRRGPGPSISGQGTETRRDHSPIPRAPRLPSLTAWTTPRASSTKRWSASTSRGRSATAGSAITHRWPWKPSCGTAGRRPCTAGWTVTGRSWRRCRPPAPRSPRTTGARRWATPAASATGRRSSSARRPGARGRTCSSSGGPGCCRASRRAPHIR